MGKRPRRTDTAPLFAAAVIAYAANVSLGTAVAARMIDTRNFRWVHHALYIATCVTTALAASAGWFGRPRRASRRAALALVPAAIPLAAIPYLGTHGRRHPIVALCAAPFLVAGLVRAFRPTHRK